MTPALVPPRPRLSASGLPSWSFASLCVAVTIHSPAIVAVRFAFA